MTTSLKSMIGSHPKVKKVQPTSSDLSVAKTATLIVPQGDVERVLFHGSVPEVDRKAKRLMLKMEFPSFRIIVLVNGPVMITHQISNFALVEGAWVRTAEKGAVTVRKQ